jgi:hypothetical protein
MCWELQFEKRVIPPVCKSLQRHKFFVPDAGNRERHKVLQTRRVVSLAWMI